MRVNNKNKLSILKLGYKSKYNIKRNSHFTTRARYALLFLVISLSVIAFPLLKVNALDSTTQTTWDGGIGTNTTNQYSDILLLDDSHSGELWTTVGGSGTLTSAIFDFGAGAYYGNASVNLAAGSGTGQAQVKIRTGSEADMSDATAWDDCDYIDNGSSVYSSNCANYGDRYLQYQFFLVADPTQTLKVGDINIQYGNDVVVPTTNASNIVIKKSPTGWTVTDGTGWSNSATPYISWSAAGDGSGSGIAGYCLYYGKGTGIDMSTSSGLLMTTQSPLKTNGRCQYATASNSINLATYLTENYVTSNGVSSGDKLYLYIQPFDKAMNLYDTVASTSFNFDNDGPDGWNFLKTQSGARKSAAETTTWYAMSGAETLGWADEDSGIAGVKYCIISSLPTPDFDQCDPDDHPENFVGPNRTSYGTSDWINDVYPYEDGTLTTDPNDPRYLNNPLGEMGSGVFWTYISPIDNAGNFFDETSIYQTVGTYTMFWSNKPKNLNGWPKADDDAPLSEDNPIVGHSNNFKFSWDAPDASDGFFYDLFGGADGIGFVVDIMLGSKEKTSYCWSVNSPFEYNEETGEVVVDPETGLPPNCHKTEQGVLELDYDAYATQQGLNTLYLMTINEPGNFSPYNYKFDEEGEVIGFSSNVAEIPFTVETLSPGIPTGFNATDISIRDDDPTKSLLQLALTWKQPNLGVDLIDHYQISRSEDGITYDDDYGSTSKSNLSFIDTSLEEKTYYYRISACDSANSCSDFSDVVSEKPVGYFTTPPNMPDISDPIVTNVGTKRATISWTTDRDSDSRIQFGTSSGKYFTQEIGNSTRTTKHSVNLESLQPGTTYYYIAKWTDAKTCKGDCTGESLEKTFSTLPAPAISEVNFTNVSISTGTINFTIENASKANIYFGKTEYFGGAKSINTSSAKSSYSIALSSLDDGTKYFIKINGFDSDGNEYQGNIYSFTTLPKPRISNLHFQPVAGAASNTTEVSWITNVPTTSELSYGISGNEKTTDTIDITLVTEHKVIISSLSDDSNYILIARSRDSLGNLAVSDAQSFKTALDTRPPKISNITVETSIKGSGAEARGQVIVSWSTDEPATSQVAYGQGAPGAYSNKTAEDSRLSYEHTVVISDLSTSSIYQVQPISDDKANNESKGTNQSAIIGRGTEDVFTIIFSSLRNIFGIKG